MRLLADQDIYAITVTLLLDNGHDVVTAAKLGLSRASDADLLHAAVADQRILVTRDRDYGALVYIAGAPGGVIYLRMAPSTQNVVHDELLRVLGKYEEKELLAAFVVIEPARHRFRSIAP